MSAVNITGIALTFWCGLPHTAGLLTAGLTPPQNAPREHVIDVTNASESGSIPSAPGVTPLSLLVPTVVVSDSPKKQVPIRVAAPLLDRPDYRIGDAFEYAVVFHNIGPAAIAFPTRPDGSAVDRDMPGAAVASIILAFDDPILGGQTLRPQLLYGAHELLGSLIAVEPGESVRIRVTSTWILSRATGAPHEPDWPRPLRLKAAVSLLGKNVEIFYERSTTTTPVQLGTKTR